MKKHKLLLLILATGLFTAWYFDLSNRIDAKAIKVFVDSYGTIGPLIYMISYALTSLVFFPAAVLSTASGMIWGPWLGTFYTVLGASFSAVVPFLLARTLGRSAVKGNLSKNANLCDNFVGDNGFFAVLLVRLVPVIPWDVANYGCGLCSIKFRDYFLATMLGIIPGSFAYNLAGAQVGKEFNPWIISISIALLTLLSLGGILFKLFVMPRRKMAKYDYDIGIIGAGAAGLSACVGATGLGARTLLIENTKSDQFGGDCLKTGCVPSKSLIKSAEVMHYLKHLRRFGLEEQQTKAVDMPKVTDRIKNIQDSIGRVDKKQRFEELGATVIQGKAHFLDRNRVVIDGQTVSAFKWIIATGSEPRIPPIPGLEDIKYYTSDSIFAIEELPENLVVIGGGPIGIEMAQAFLRLGSKVTIIDAGSHILGVEDEDLVLPVIETLKNEGAEILTNAKTIKVSPQKGAIIVEVEQNERKFEITGTHLLVATGRKPVAESLQPEKAGVEVQRSAIVTNQRMRTSASNIFACGDCNGKFLFTHVASAEAAVAIANALLHIPKTMNYDHVPWCTYTDPEVASIGLNKKRAAAADIEYEILEAAFADVDRAETESETVGFARALIDKKGRLLGAQIVGKHAGELIHSLIPFVVGKKKITQAAANIVIYPCRSDYLKKLQSEYLKKKFFNPTWKARLKTLFGFRG